MKTNVIKSGFLFLFFLVAGLDVHAQPSSFAQARMLGQGGNQIRGPGDIPPGRFQQKVENLPPRAQARALEWLNRFSFPPEDVDSLNADPEGGIYYTCFTPKVAEGSGNVQPTSSGNIQPAAPIAVSPFPDSLKFSSRTGAPNTVFLDFDGHVVSGTAWNTAYTNSSFSARAFSTDTNYTTYSDAEQAAIKRIWQRVAEDFSSYNVNVTTIQPATFNNRTGRLLITGARDANGNYNPAGQSAGGIAYVGVFNSSTYVGTYSPAWVYHDNLANSEDLIAEAASHEFGHNLNLSHDGKTDGTGYYGGHGTGEISWGTIMGTGYDQNVSQWSKGEYYLANNTQDDTAIIAGYLSYRTDDHGNTNNTATALSFDTLGNLRASNPETDPANVTNLNKGVIERTNDVDVFSFNATNGAAKIYVSPWVSPVNTRGGNVDLRVRLYNSAMSLLADVNPTDQTRASIETNLSAGLHYLHISTVGVGSPSANPPNGYTQYGSIGQYFITGQVAIAAATVRLEGNLNFGSVPVGGSARRTLMIHNDNPQAITVTNITFPSGFSGLWTGALPALSSREVPITFSPAAAGFVSTSLVVLVSGDGAPQSQALLGTGTTNFFLAITNVPAVSSVSNAVSTASLRGVAGNGLSGLIRWTNAPAGASGSIAWATNWLVSGIPLSLGTNVITLNGTNAPAGGTIATDAASQSSYLDGWTSGDNGGSGFNSWILQSSGANSGFFRATTSVNTRLSFSSDGWGLWANSGDVANAFRPFARPLESGDTVRVQFDNNWILTGSSVGVALLNSDGDWLFEFYFTGGGSGYIINDAVTSRATGIGYTDAGLNIALTLTSTNTYRLQAGDTTLTGTFASRTNMQPTRFRAWNFNAGAGEDYNFYINELTVTNAPPAPSSTNVTATIIRLGLPPPAPQLSVANVEDNRFDAFWTASVGATGYVLEVHANSSFTAAISGYSNLTTSATNTLVSGLQAGFTYYVRVRAVSENGGSEYSVTNVTTLGQPRQIQTITFPSIGTQAATNTLALSATASSGLPVSFTLSSGPAILSTNNTLTFNGTGVVSVTASQPGNQFYFAAIDVSSTFDVIKATPAIVASPSATAINNGQSLASSSLIGGVADVPGVFSWLNPAIVPPVGVSTQQILFTPFDMDRVAIITATINMQVLVPAMAVHPTNTQSFVLSAGVTTNFILQIINSGTAPLDWTLDAFSYDLRDDMEQGTNGWSVYGDNATWHLSTNRAYSGDYAWYSGTPGSSLHGSNMVAYAELPWVHLHTNAPSLRFQHWGDMEQDTPTVAWDGGYVGIIDQNGDLYLPGTTNQYAHRWYYDTNILIFSGSFDWSEAMFDLSPFAGQSVKPVFIFVADELFQMEGWYIDDVAISPRTEDGEWLTINPLTSTVAAGSTGMVTVTLSTTMLSPGAIRSADLTVAGNDPATPEQSLRIDLALMKEAGTVALSNLAQIFDGQPKPVMATTSPTGLLVNVTYNGSPNPPSAIGTYTVVGEIDSGIYEGAATGTLSIVMLEGAIAVEDSVGDADDLAMAFGEVDVGDEQLELITIRNTNSTYNLTITDIRLTGGLAPAPISSSIAPARQPEKSKPSPQHLRAQALTSTAAREPDSIIVKFKPSSSALSQRAALHAAMGNRPLRSFSLLPADVVELPAGQSMASAIDAYQASDAVEYAEPNFIYTLNSTPNDPAFTNLWGLNNTGQSGGTPGADISALDAWAKTTGSTNVIVAVIDTGIDYNHPDLAANMWVNPNPDPALGDVHGARFISGNGEPTSGNPMDDHGHGTHVAGTIGAVGNNGVGVAGVNWNVRLMALKFITSANEGSLADAIACIEYAIEHGAHLSNNSWGGGGYSQAMKDAIDAAARSNQLFVAAAGNDGANNDTAAFYPANYDAPNVISVANSTRNDVRSSSSNYGTNKVHLAAPGTAITSTWPGNTYLTISGTSMAAPHVAGVAALLLARHPNAPYADVRRWMLDNVDPLPAWTTLVQTGGRLNAAAAIEDAQFGTSLTNALPIIIPPGGTATIPVRYLPTRREDVVDTVVISNNDQLKPEVEISLSGRGMGTQTITFPAIANQFATNVVNLSATATSGSNVTFSVTGPAVLVGSQLTFTNAGQVSVVASQADSTYWRPAPEVTNSFLVSKVNQAISFAISPSWRNITNPALLSASASSGLPVDFAVASGPGTIDAALLSFSGAGEVVVAADQPGNGQFAAATQATARVQVYIDADANAVPDSWEDQYFAPEYQLTPVSDQDQDGIPDAQEFIAGTNPTNASDRLAMQTTNSAPAQAGNALVLRWPSVTDRYYTIVYKTNLLESFTPIISGLGGTPPVNVYTSALPATTGPMYYRIGVTLEP